MAPHAARLCGSREPPAGREQIETRTDDKTNKYPVDRRRPDGASGSRGGEFELILEGGLLLAMLLT